mgnify:CR=1 FL=1
MKQRNLFVDILIAVPITALLVLFINKLTDIITGEIPLEEKKKKNIIISFIAGLVGILIGWKVFYKSKLKNRPVMISLFVASSFLIINSLFFNWDGLTNDTKLLMLGVVLVGMIIVSYL